MVLYKVDNFRITSYVWTPSNSGLPECAHILFYEKVMVFVSQVKYLNEVKVCIVYREMGIMMYLLYLKGV
jgi:hypothetical protein